MKAVIFDMDGTLFDTESLAIKAFDYAGEKIGIGKAGYITYSILGLTVEAARPIWTAEFGDGYREKELLYYKNEFVENYFCEHGVPAKKGAEKILSFLKASGYKIGIASSTKYEKVQRLLKLSGIFDYFDDITTGDMVKNSKPAPDIFLLAAERIGMMPCECMAIEDGKYGLRSAKTAGYGEVILVPDLLMPDDEMKADTTFIGEDLTVVMDYIKEKYGK